VGAVLLFHSFFLSPYFYFLVSILGLRIDILELNDKV